MVGPWVMRATVALEAWVGGTMAPASAPHSNTTTPAAVKALLISTSPLEEGISLSLDAELPPGEIQNLPLVPPVKARGFHDCSHLLEIRGGFRGCFELGLSGIINNIGPAEE